MVRICLLFAIVAASASTPEGGGAIRGNVFDRDLHGTIFVLDSEKSTLSVYSKEFSLKQVIGGPGWQNDQFDRPTGIWARNGMDIFVADYGNHRIQRFDRTLTLISSFATRESQNEAERFGYPQDVAMSRLGDLFIVDGENRRIVKVNRFNRVETTFGGFGAGKGRLRSPTRIEVGPKDVVLVLDESRILMFDTFGNFLREMGAFRKPVSLFANEQTVVVADDDGVTTFDAEGRMISTLPSEWLATDSLGNVKDIHMTQEGLLLLTDKGITTVSDRRIQRKEN